MIFLVILIAYAALMVAYGVFVSRRVRASGDFFVAGRGLGAGLIFSTMLASNIGAGSTVGATGLGYRDGLLAWWWVGSAGIGSLVLALSVGPRIWRIARDRNLFTVGDYLEHRYNRSVRGLVALLLCAGSLSVIAGQLIAVAWILSVVAGIPKPFGCLIAAAVITTYFAFGGLHSTARVNVIQLIVKLVGFAAVLIYLLMSGDGLGQPATSELVHPATQGGALPAILRYVAILAPSFVVSPGLLQKAFGARDERAVRTGVGLNALALLAYAIVPVLLGVIARTRFPELANNELALPTLLNQALPFALGALLLAAIFSAELSAADAGLFMLTTSLSKDLYRSFLRPAASEPELMRVVRGAALVCGSISALLAILLPSVISALTIFYTLLTAALLLPLLAGLYTTRVTSNTAILTIFVSVAFTLGIELATQSKGIAGIPSVVVGIAAGGIVMASGTILATQRRQNR